MLENQLFSGRVRHRRFGPKPHAFAYNLFMFGFDIGELPTLFPTINQIGFERLNWFAFQRKNYLSDPEIGLDACARQLIHSKFATYPSGKIYLLTHLSCLGYCFNPISLYCVYDADNQYLEYLIIEVTNTPWSEKHHYVLKTQSCSTLGSYRFQFPKVLHVSPFMGMNYEYHVTLKLSNQKLILHMENRVNDHKAFDATLMLNGVEPTPAAFKQLARRYPLMTYKVSLAIYWQALKLWIKGVPFHPHPKTLKRNKANG